MKQQISNTNHSIRKNTVISILLSGIGYLYPILVFAYISRILTPSGLGRLTFTSSVTAYFALFVGMGMPTYGLRAVAAQRRSKGDLSQLTAELMIIRILSGILIWFVFFILLRLFIVDKSNDALFMVFGFSILISIFDCSWLYKGMEEYSSQVWISTLVRLSGIIAVFILVRQVHDIKAYAWITVLIPLMMHLAEIVVAERKWHLHIGSQCVMILSSGKLFQAIQKHIRQLFLFLLMSCAVTIYGHTDTVMLGLMKSERVVGLYACATKIKLVLPVLTGTLWAAALPRSADLWRRKKTIEFRTLSEKSLHVVYMVMLPLTVYFCVFAEPWIFLIGGEEYIGAAQTMRILVLAVIPIGISNIIGGQMLIPMGLEKKLFQAEAIAAVGNIVMNMVLIPVLSASGAAIATTVSEVFVALFVGWVVCKQIKIQIIPKRIFYHSLIGCAVATIMTCGLFRLLLISDYLKTLISFIFFVSVFGLLMLLLQDALYREFFNFLRKEIRRILPEATFKYLRKVRKWIKTLFYRMVMVVFHRKTKYYCPCCGIRFCFFVEGGFLKHSERYDPLRYEHTRQDVICPVCYSGPRHRILALWCYANKEVLQSARILYFAPEESMMCWMKRNDILSITADLYAPADLKLDIQNTELSGQSFDMIFCNHVLEHVNDLQKALKELHRILKLGGYLICSFPMDPKIESLDETKEELSDVERIQRFGQVDHKRVFGMNADQLLTNAGFVVEKISGEDYPKEILPIIGPADYDMNCLFMCRKE